MEQKRPTTSFVIPKKRRVEVETPAAPVIPEGYEIRAATSAEQSAIIEQLKIKYPDRIPSCEESWKNMQTQKIEIIVNARLEHSFQTYKKRTTPSEETLGFRVAFDREEVVSIAENGLKVGSDSLADIGDPSRGVVVYSSPALASSSRFLYTNTSIIIVGFRTVRGKFLEVGLNSGRIDPSTKHNSHVPFKTENDTKTTNALVLEHRLGAVYHYEHLPNGKDVQKFPSSILPHFVVTFKLPDGARDSKDGRIVRALSVFTPIHGGSHALRLGNCTMKTLLFMQQQVHKAVPYILINEIVSEPVMMKVSSADDILELKALRTNLYGRLLSSETVFINLPSMKQTGLASYFLVRLPEKGLVRTFWKRKFFFVWERYPWKLFYIPSGDFSAEFGFPYMPETMHVIAYRQERYLANCYYIGLDLEKNVNWATPNRYALNPRKPEPRESQMIIPENVPDEEVVPVEQEVVRSSPVLLPIHASLTKTPGPSILRTIGTVRTTRVTFKEDIVEVRFFDSDSPDQRPPEREMSFAEKRKEDQLTEKQLKEKEMIDADFKNAMQIHQRSASVEGESSNQVKPAVVPIPAVPVNQSFSIPPPTFKPAMAVPINRPPANFSVPPPPIPAPVPPFHPTKGPYSIPPPRLPPTRTIPQPDFSKPPPPFIPKSTPINIPPPMIIKPPPISSVVPTKVVEEEIGEAPMDVSFDDKEEEVEKKDEEKEKEKEVVEEEPSKKQDAHDDNDILKMAFSQVVPQASEPSLSTSDLLATLSSLNPETVKMLRNKELSKSAEEPEDSDVRSASTSVAFSIHPSKPTTKQNGNVLGADDDEEQTAEAPKDIDYRHTAAVISKLNEYYSKQSEKKKLSPVPTPSTKDRDDRPQDIDERVAPKEPIISDANRRKASDSLQGKLRASGKEFDNRIQNIMKMPDSMMSSNSLISVIAPSLLNCNIGPNGLVTKPNEAPKKPDSPPPASPEPEQIRSPSPMDSDVPHVDTFLNQQKCVIVPTESKEGYSTFRGETVPSTSTPSKKSPKKHAKFPRDHDSVMDSKTSDKKAADSWNHLMSRPRGVRTAEKTGDKEDGELNSDDETKSSSTPSSSSEKVAVPVVAEPKHLKYPLTRGVNRGRGGGHQFHRQPPNLIQPPVQFFQAPAPNFNSRGRGRGFPLPASGHFFNRAPPIPRGFDYLERLAPVFNPNVVNYSIFIDPDLSTNTILPSELDALFLELSKLKKRRDDGEPNVHATVYVHSSVNKIMADNKNKETSKFFHTFRNYNNRIENLVEFLPPHMCDSSVAPRSSDMAECMVRINQKKGGKEVIFITHYHKTDSEVFRTLTARNIRVMKIKELVRHLEEHEGVRIYV